MIKSIFRRVVYVILLVWIVTLIAFWLSKQVPGDEVMDFISIDERGHSSFNPVEHRRVYERVARARGLDLPDFYFTILPGYMDDSLQFILPKDDRNVVKHWTHFSENGKSSLVLYNLLRKGLFRSCEQSNTND